MNPPRRTIDRRQFLEGMAAASAFAIIPRSVLGGPNYVAPSDRLNIGMVGCGTQTLRSVLPGLLRREDLQVTCVCDPNRDSSNYVDWSRDGVRNSIRRLLEDSSWGENDTGIRGGREVARQVAESFYGKANRSGGFDGIGSYADFRELLEQETDLDGIVAVTPDHTHAAIAIAALNKHKAAVVHKPVSNVLDEVRKAVQAARDSQAPSHLLAWSDREDYYTINAWFTAGVIGPVREVHNWSNRPSWPQGWRDYHTESVPVPEGFDWDLWLGPEQHRPYHPTYTHALYRGWYAYGGGSFADMGNYSLWFVYRLLDLDAPVSVEGRCNSVPFLTEENVSRREVSQVAFPLAGSIHFRHAARGAHPPVDVYWYEGGMKPQTPPELLEAGQELAAEGMMFVGDNGKILAGYRGTDPRLIPEGRMVDVEGPVDASDVEIVGGNDEWINAIRNGGKSRGSYESVAPLAEATALAAIAYRFPGRRLEWDAANTRFTNEPEANELVRRNYRTGWEL